MHSCKLSAIGFIIISLYLTNTTTKNPKNDTHFRLERLASPKEANIAGGGDIARIP
jgi:hypothetical protein